MSEAISVPYMNAGDEAFSYANNSLLQKAMILKAKPVLEQTIKTMLSSINFPATTLNIADLGCGSGPNAMLVISGILNALYHLSTKQPQVHVFLNDLPGNDFNSIFKSLPSFYQMGSVFVSGTPGSYYGRLFPDRSMHLVHSTSSLNWLSQAPKLMECNKANVYLSNSSSSVVFQAYLEQFRTDFGLFLRSRAEEKRLLKEDVWFLLLFRGGGVTLDSRPGIGFQNLFRIWLMRE